MTESTLPRLSSAVAPLRLATSAVAITAALTLVGCSVLPVPGTDAPVATPAPADTAAPDAAPSQADPDILVLADDEVTELIEYSKSEPAGSFSIGSGVPAAFPAGVPTFTNRWIKNNVREGTTAEGLPYYSAMFWGDYAALDELSVHFLELGFAKEQRQDDTKRVIIYQNDRYRVIINATETAVNHPSTDLVDPAYTMLIVFLD